MAISLYQRRLGANGVWTPSVLTPFTFPGGEPHIKGGDEPTADVQLAYVTRPTSHDMITLLMWADTVHERRELAYIAMPYLPGARADRGRPYGAGIYAQLLNSMNAATVLAVDPHSSTMPGIINNFRDYPVWRIIRSRLGDRGDRRDGRYAGVIAPDNGALYRAKCAAAGLHVPVYRAKKQRAFETGQLSSFEMIDELPAEGRFLIVDDICDGGGTFIGLADVLGLPRERLDLWVTHGIFSKGFKDLSERFGQIHTTDSFTSLRAADEVDVLTVHPIMSILLGELSYA